jgi:hypothetical protein
VKADIDVEWSALDTLQPPFKCLNIGEMLKFEDFPEAQRLKVWDEMYVTTETPLY